MADAQAAIDRIAVTRPIMAIRTRDYARSLFNWATQRGLVTSNPFSTVVCEGRERSRERVLSDLELGRLWNASASLGVIGSAFVRLLILTLQRRQEVAGLRWVEISDDGFTWTLPPERTKSRRGHLVHLSPASRAVLASLPRRLMPDGGTSELVLTTTGRTPLAGFQNIRDRLARLMDEATSPSGSTLRDTWRFHDIRRTGVTRLAGMGISPHVADKILNHASGSIRGVAAVYQRHEYLQDRARALEAWADHVQACAARSAAGNVVAPDTGERASRS